MMSREAWRLIRHSKQFYVSSFHKVLNFILFSVGVNLILGFLIYHAYFNQPDRQYYATNGAMPPEELAPMDSPNMTSVPLLANDPDSTEEIKVMPQ